MGQHGPAKALKKQWIGHNKLLQRDVRTLQNSSAQGCRYFSVCYSAPTKGWHKTHYGCRAHINLVGKDPEDVLVKSVELQHTCLAEDAQRKRNYKMSEIENMSEAVAMYQLTSNREGNAKQLSNITKASTGLELGLSQAYRSIHERANDTIHAQIGQYMLIPDLFRVLKEQDPQGSQVLECQDCLWDKDKHVHGGPVLVVQVLERNHTGHPIVVEGAHFSSQSIGTFLVECGRALSLDGHDLCLPAILFGKGGESVELLVETGSVEKGNRHDSRSKVLLAALLCLLLRLLHSLVFCD